MKSILLAAGSIVALASASLAQPCSAFEQSREADVFSSTGTEEPKPIAQEGRRADALRRNLEKIQLPAGFKIELYAVVPDAASYGDRP